MSVLEIRRSPLNEICDGCSGVILPNRRHVGRDAPNRKEFDLALCPVCVDRLTVLTKGARALDKKELMAMQRGRLPFLEGIGK